MPLARISVPSALPPAKVRALADAVLEGLVETCSVPPNDRFQLISAYAPEMMLMDPTFPDVKRTSEASIVEILFLEGRTIKQRARLFRRIAERAISAGFAGDDIMIILTENTSQDWSLGHGHMFGDQHAPLATGPAETPARNQVSFVESGCVDGQATATLPR